MEAISKQLVLSTQSGRLKPDVRLGVAVSEFAQSLDDDRKREFQKMQAAGTQLCGRDAIRVTEELNRKSERSHQTWRPYGTKCGKFLDRLQTLANIGDVMIGGSQNVIATSIWCAVRLSLQVCNPETPFANDLFVADLQTATNFRGYFERLSSLFMKLGTSWELHHEFSQIFPQSAALQTFLCEYLLVLMRLCRKAVLFSNKSLAGQLWSSLGASFESEFKPLQEEMDKWGLLIQHKTQQLATTHVVDAEMFRRRDYKQRILHLLSPNQSQHITTWRRHRRKGECKWIYQTKAFNSWIAEDASSTLCISGKLGSGKTVAMANLVAQMNLQQTCAFYFCAFKDEESLKAKTVLGSIAFHLLDSIPGDDTTWDVLSRQEGTTSRALTSTGIIRLLTDLLPEHTKYVVVLDGLEDCPEDEITEVVDGLRRLMARRKVLLCYSARSGSTFQRLTAQTLAAKYSFSLAEKMHDEEIKAYITEEVARRKQTSQPGLFSDKLVELVEKQLLAGAQGMYLWVSLQLDSIFPSQPRTIVTYDQILNLINNLPKDLPEAFERALEGIIDDRYGDAIMKIVMAAGSPLTLDELRVALTVVPGDPTWYAAKVPTNAIQLVALCGGNLLEVDEEDGKVRFIHYSVANHLLRPTKNPRTVLYHFSMQEAEIHSGTICVTFLNMPMFETAVTKTAIVDGEKLAEKVIGAATQQQPLLGLLVHHFKRKDREQVMSTELDFGRLLAEIQATRMLNFDPRCFEDYAVSNWLPHSRSLERGDAVGEAVWHLWMRLLCGDMELLRPPFQSPAKDCWSALSWALEHHHEPLIQAIFKEPTIAPQDGEHLARGVLKLASSPSNRYDCACLGLILVHLFNLTVNIKLFDMATAPESGHMQFQALHQLLDLGADLSIPYENNILKMLLEALSRIRESSSWGLLLRIFLERVLAFSGMQPLLREAWVPHALRKILEYGNILTFKRILLYRPELLMPADQVSIVGVAVFGRNYDLVGTLLDILPNGDSLAPGNKPAMQLALERQNRDILILLAENGGLDNSDSIGRLSASLLKIAIERMNAEWLDLLLGLGADPDTSIGYSVTVEPPILSYLPVCHLQITAERNQTLKFLILLRYRADPSIPAIHQIYDRITDPYNRVIMAKLKEIEYFGPAEYFRATAAKNRDDGIRFPFSALLEACKMLVEDLSEDQILKSFGVTQSHDISIAAKRKELKRILLELAKATPLNQLNVQCPEGNTALHYLIGGMPHFNSEALRVASYLLDVDGMKSWWTMRNNHGQTPLRRAIYRASRNSWGPAYMSSLSILWAKIPSAVLSNEGLAGADSILAVAILKGENIETAVSSIIHAGANMNATLGGATPLEIAVNMPSLEYGARATYCLLAHGADPSVKLSTGQSLLDSMDPIKRDWLHRRMKNCANEPCRGESNCKYVLVDDQQVRNWKWLIGPDE